MERKDFPFKSFWGNDEDYGGYPHRYMEPDSDRGATDEVHKPRANSRFRKHGVKLW